MKRLLLSSALVTTACAAPTPPASPASVEVSEPSTDWAGIVDAEARALGEAHPGAQVRVVVFDADAGEVLATHGDVSAPTPTGSTIKPLTVWAALAVGLDPNLEIDASAPLKVGDQTIQDAANNGVLTLPQAIAKSSNIAVARVVQAVPWQEVYAAVRKRVPLPDPEGMTLVEAVGQLDGFATRVPLEALVRAYASMEHEPHGDAVLDMLRLAVTEDGTGRRAVVDGLEVLGKTGTARIEGVQDAVFVGRAGDGTQAVWIGVSVHDVPEDAYGGSVSAPAFARIAAAGLGD